jgi:hypothetical protein
MGGWGVGRRSLASTFLADTLRVALIIECGHDAFVVTVWMTMPHGAPIHSQPQRIVLQLLAGRVANRSSRVYRPNLIHKRARARIVRASMKSSNAR